jgi:membrane protein
VNDAKEALRVFLRARGRVLGASVAFYAMLSVAPMLLIALRIAGAVARTVDAKSALAAELARWVGESGARTVVATIDRTSQSEGGAIASALGAVLLVYSATRLFSALEYALDAMWGATNRDDDDALKDKALRQLRKRGVAFAVTFLVAVLLLLAQALRTSLAVVSSFAPASPEIPHVAEALVSFAVTSLLFFLLFMTLPSARIGARDAAIGAMITAALFAVGSALVGVYLAAKDVARAWGDAGAVVVLLVWVHYSAQIFLLGAAYTGVRARRSGSLAAR